MPRKTPKHLIQGAAVIFIAMQFVQPARKNPPANPAASFAAVAKPAPEVAAIFQRACGDCHSNETTWPWYSRVAPASWLVADDVKKGRAHMNLSEWSFLSPEASRLKLKAACKLVREQEMPLWQYRLMHSEARLTSAEVDQICSASDATTPRR
jgi:hypothetical protein